MQLNFLFVFLLDLNNRLYVFDVWKRKFYGYFGWFYVPGIWFCDISFYLLYTNIDKKLLVNVLIQY